MPTSDALRWILTRALVWVYSAPYSCSRGRMVRLKGLNWSKIDAHPLSPFIIYIYTINDN